MILLETRRTEDGKIEIVKSRTDGSIYYLQGVGIQSHGDENGEALLSYGQAMCCLALAGGAKSVLVIGCAGGTIATTLHRRRIKVATVDVNHHAFELAARYFNLPEEVETHVADGRGFLLRDSRRWDTILIDAYDGIEMSSRLMTVDFYRLVAARLNPRGAVVANIVIDSPADRTADRIASAMRHAGLPVRLFDDSDKTGGNCLIVGGEVDLDLKRLHPADSRFSNALSWFKSRSPVDCRPLRDWVVHRTTK